MSCTNCGRGTELPGYTVHFESAGGDGTEMDLVLCSACAEEFRAERGIQLERTDMSGDSRQR